MSDAPIRELPPRKPPEDPEEADRKRRAEEEQGARLQGYIRVKRAIKRQGWWWPGED